MNSISFVSNTRTTLAARLFACAIARSPALINYRLVTTCATDLELLVFRGWTQRDRTVDLVLPPEWSGKPGPKQQEIIDIVHHSGGRLIESVASDDFEDGRLIKVIRMTQVCLLMELEGTHWLLNWSQQLFSPLRTLAFQWAIQSPENIGGAHLVDTGKATALYPAQWAKHLSQYLDGDLLLGQRQPRQLKLL